MGVGDDIAPRFTQKPALRQEDGGQRLVFQCVLEASPQPDIAWFRGTTPLTSSDRVRMRVEGAGGSAYNVIMEILGVTQNDAGTYKVTAKNRLGEVSASINLNFSAGGQKQQDGIAPNFIQKPVTRQENNGQTLLFECVLTADPAPSITWFRDSTTLQAGDRYSIRTEPREKNTYFLVLEIKGVSAQDAGNYKVTAKNALGESNATIRLNFDSSDATQMKGSRPIFLQKPTIRQVGDKIVLECKMTAEPKPSITWMRDSQPISFAPGSRLVPHIFSEGASHTITLEISQVSMADAGEYRAVAKNELGEATATLTLNFEGAKKPQLPEGKAPHFTQKPTIKQQQSLLILTCLLEANPTPQIRWFHDTTEVGAGGRYSITLQRDAGGADLYTAVLQIKDPKTEDGGTYKCTAANDLGESNANITLNFQGGEKAPKPGGIAPTFKEKPKVSQDPSGKNVIISCVCTANPKPSIIWLKGTSPLQTSARIVPSVDEKGDEYTFKLEIMNFTTEDSGVYKVTAKNDVGEGSANITINLEPPKEPPPQPQGKPSIRLEDNGRKIVIEQCIASPSIPSSAWFFGNQPLNSGGRYNIKVAPERDLYYLVLEITDFSDKDSGTYKIVAKTNGGEATSTATLNVEALKPKVKGEAPKFTQKLAPKIVNDGDAVDLMAKVTGTEPIEATWSKDGKPIIPSDIYSITYDKGTSRLYIPEVFPEDAGNYTISVKNQWGSASSMASLQVKEVKDEPKQDAKPGKSQMEISLQSKVEFKQETQPLPPVELEMQSQTLMTQAKQPEPPKPPEPEPAKGIIQKDAAVPKKEEVPPSTPKKEPSPVPPKKEPSPVVPKKEPSPVVPKKEPSPAVVPKKEPSPAAPKKEPSPAAAPKKEPSPVPKKEEPKPKEPPAPKKEEPPKDAPPAPKAKEPPAPKKEEPVAPAPKKEPSPAPKKPEPASKVENPSIIVDDDKALIDAGKVSVDRLGEAKDKPVGDGPFIKEKPQNQVVVEGQTLKMDVDINLNGKPMPNVRFMRGTRELREDSRISIHAGDGKATLEIKKTRLTDEAKYAVSLEQNGVITDTATFSVFIKDPKDSNLDFRALLKHREQNKKKDEEEDIDWGALKPVDKKGRRLSQIELTKMALKKVDESKTSDSEEEKPSERKRGEYKRQDRNRVELEASSDLSSETLTLEKARGQHLDAFFLLMLV